MNYNDMMRNVAGSTGLTRKQSDEAVVTTLTGLAETRVRAVFSVLTQAVNSGEMNDIAEELGDGYADLLDRTDRLERAEARELAEEAAEARREAARAILDAPEPALGFATPAFETPAPSFGDSPSEPAGTILDLVLSVPAALAHVVVAVLRRPVQTGIGLVALVRR